MDTFLLSGNATEPPITTVVVYENERPRLQQTFDEAYRAAYAIVNSLNDKHIKMCDQQWDQYKTEYKQYINKKTEYENKSRLLTIFEEPPTEPTRPLVDRSKRTVTVFDTQLQQFAAFRQWLAASPVDGCLIESVEGTAANSMMYRLMAENHSPLSQTQHGTGELQLVPIDKDTL